MPVAKQVMLPLAAWSDLQIPLLQLDNGGAYIPLRPLCQTLLGTDDDRPQRSRIKHDPILSQLTSHLPVQTPGGTQAMLCLSWLGIGRWIDRLNLASVREHIAPAFSILCGQSRLLLTRLLVDNTPCLP